MNLRFPAGLLLGFGIGFGCRIAGIPVPAPPVLLGSLLVVAMTVGHLLGGWHPRRAVAGGSVSTGTTRSGERR